MASYKTLVLITAAALQALPINLAWAQQKIEEVGTDVAMSDNKLVELESGHDVVLISQKGLTTTENTSNPINMSSLDCVSMFEDLPGEKYKGEGFCTNTDKDGDKLFAHWNASSEQPQDRYEVIGGTGKFEGAKGGGTSTTTEISHGSQGRSVTHWKGAAEYPNVHK